MVGGTRKGSGRPRASVNKGWCRKLARRLVLADAPVKALGTLKDAADLMAEHFPPQNSPANRKAIEPLIEAAENGREEDIEAATEQVARILRFRRWLF